MNNISTNIFSWRKAVLVSFGVGLLAAGLSVFVQAHGATMQDLVAEGPKPVAAIHTAVGLGSSFEMPGQPKRLIIPAIGVDAKIESIGLSWHNDGTLGVPSNFTNVAWYKKGPRPGMPGSAVIDGHLDGKNVKEAVFYDLGNLKPGDLVEVVNAKGLTLTFKVVDIKTYDYDAPTADIFSHDTSAARLNLITCAGTWDKAQKIYDKRVVVFTELVTN